MNTFTIILTAFILLTFSFPILADEDSTESINLWPDKPPHSAPGNTFIPSLTPFLLKTNEPKSAVLVLPGGGYAGRAAHEGAPVAQMFNKAGFHAFVLNYRVIPNHHPAPLMDAIRAMRIIRYHAREWKVRPDKIAAIGFSAGGHLTGSLGIFYKKEEPDDIDPIKHFSSRPDAIILCYPVISSGEYRHTGSFNNLLGTDASQEERDALSLELHVHVGMPPAFIWHTANDPAVPVENSLLFAMALHKKHIPFEMHIYPDGRHGLGLAPDNPHVATWSTLCVEWLRGMGW